MGEKVSWQELMRIKCDNDFDDDDDDGSLSPVFHKNKWVVVRKPTNLKEPASCQSDDKSLSNEGCAISSQIDRASYSKEEKIKVSCKLSKNTKEVTEQLTPVRKNRPTKRKLINLIDTSLEGSSSQTNYEISKKTKTHNQPQKLENFFSQPKNDANKSELGKTNLSENLIKSESQPVNSLQKKKLIDLNNVKRRLIYSINKKPLEKRVCPENLTINNFYKSVIMLEEADKIVSMKSAKKSEFHKFSEDFVSVTDLNNKMSDLSKVENNYNQDRMFEGSCKSVADVSDDCPSPVRHNLLNDSFVNFQFTEVEECFRRAKPLQITENKAESVGHPNVMEKDTFMNKDVPLLNNGNEDCLRKELDSSCNNAKKVANILEKSCASVPDVVQSKNCNQTMQKITEHQSCNDLDCEEVVLFESKKNYDSQTIPKSSYYPLHDEDHNKDNQAGPSGISPSSKEKSLLVDSKVASSKFEDLMKDSVVFYDVSSQDDMFEHRSSPVDNVPEAEVGTSELNKTPLQLSNSVAVKRVRENLKTLLTPNSAGSSVDERVRKSDSSVSKSVLDIKLERPLIKLSSQSTSCDGSLLELGCNFISMPNLQTDKTELSSDKGDLASPSSKVTLNRSVYSELNTSYSKDTEENTGEEEKQAIESLLQDVLDNKNSAVPIQAYLSEDFSYAPSTLVQFSTASGSVVRTTQAGLDKANAIMKDVLDGERKVFNEEESQDHNEESTVTLIEVPEENLLKAKALLNDTLDGISCTQVMKEDSRPSTSNIKHLKTSVKNNSLASEVVGKVPQLVTLMAQENQSDLSSIKQDINMKNNFFNLRSSKQHSTDPCSSKMGALLKFTRVLPENNSEKEEDCVLDLKSSISDDIFQSKTKVGDSNVLEYGTSSYGKPNNEPFKIPADIINNEDCPELYNAKDSKNQVFEKNVLSSGILQAMATLPQSEKQSTIDSATSLMKEVRNSRHNQLDVLHGNQMKQPDKNTCEFLDSIESKCNLRTKAESASPQNESGYDFLEVEKTTRNPGIKLVNPIVTEQHFKKVNTKSVECSESKPATDQTSSLNLAGRSFSTAAGGSVSVSEESLRKVRSDTNGDSLFEQSKELSYNFSSIGDNTILMVKEDAGTVKFKDISLCSSKSSQKDLKLSEKNIKDVNSFNKNLLLSQNASIFVSSQLCHTYEGKSTQNMKTNFKINEENKNDNNYLTNSSFLKDLFGNCHSLGLTNDKPDLGVRSEIHTFISSAKGETGEEIATSSEGTQQKKRKRLSLSTPKAHVHKLRSLQTSQLKDEQCYSFSTAAGSEVYVPEECLQTDKHQLKDEIASEDMFLQDPVQLSKTCHIPSTTSGSKVTVSEDSLTAVTLKFTDESDAGSTHLQESRELAGERYPNKNQGFSFSTASGSKVSVSEDSLTAVKLKFMDESDAGSAHLQESSRELAGERYSNKNQRASFSTASGSKVSVSEDRLEAMKLRFNDVLDAGSAELQESRELAAERYPNKNQGVSFSTASGSKVSVSEDRLEAMKLRFNDVLDAGSAELQESRELAVERYPNKNQGVSFSTASGSKVSVSEDRLKAMKLKFNDVLDAGSAELQESRELAAERYPNKNQGVFFSTASGSKVSVSEDRLKAMKLKFNDVLDADSAHFQESRELARERYPNKNQGASFSTASGSKGSVSEDRLEAMKLRFNDVLDAGSAELQESREIAAERHPNKNQGVSFSTASGSKVSVSEDRLKAMKLKFNDVLDADSAHLQESRELAGERYPNKNQEVSFSTASGSKVSVSEDRLKAIKLRFNDVLDAGSAELQESRELAGGRNPNKNQEVSFSTASGSKVSVSEDRLEAIKLRFNDVLDAGRVQLQESTELAGGRNPNKNQEVSFSTASGSKVSVSEDRLKAMKLRFNDVLDAGSAELQESRELAGERYPNKNQEFSFSTALGSKVGVSEDSMKAVNPKFYDELDVGNVQLQESRELAGERYPSKNLGASFSTASGSIVSVSEDRLEAMKLRFNDVLDAGSAELQESRELAGERYPSKNQEVSFSTASGSKVSVSEDRLKAMKLKFNDVLDAGSAHLQESTELAGGRYPNKNQGFSFSTALGSKVSVSEDSLNAVKLEFTDESDAGRAKLQESRELDGERYPNNNQEGVSFSTASGSKVCVSEDRLKAMKLRFNDVLDAGSADLQESRELAGVSYPNKNQGFSFSTALGSKVSVSEDSLKAVKLEFTDESDSGRAQLQDSKEFAWERQPNKNQGVSFSTTSGSKVSVSEDSFKTCNLENLLENILVANRSNIKNKSMFPSLNQCGSTFPTAQIKRIGVSEENFRKVKEQFKDEHPSEIIIGGKLNSSFPTAKDSIVNASEECSQNMRLEFEEEFDINKVQGFVNFSKPHNEKEREFYFSTAQGTKIVVSEDCLQKGRLLFKDGFDMKVQSEKNSFDLPLSVGHDSPTSAQRNDLKEYDTDDTPHLYMMDTQLGYPTDFQDTETLKPNEATSSKDAHSSFLSDPNSSLHPSQLENKSDLFLHFTQSIGGPLLNEELNRLESHISKISDSKCFQSGSNSVTVDQNQLPFQQSISVNERHTSNESELETLNERAIGDTKTFVKSSDKKLSNLLQVCNTVNSSTSNHPDAENFTKENKHDYSNSDRNFSVESISVDLCDLKSRVSAESKTHKLSGTCLLSVTQEVSDSAAALIDDSEGFCGKPFVTTPSSAFNRNYLKPITAWSLELDNDDDILAAAETPKKAGSFLSDSSEVSVSSSPKSEKRKSVTEAPLESENKKIKLSDDQIDDKVVTEEILTMRKKRREEQNFKINLKKQNSPSISAGLYMSIRSRQALSTFMDSPLNNPQLFSYEELLELGVHEDVINVTAKNAIDFKFTSHQYFSFEECFSKDGQINLGNGFMVVLSDNNEVGLEEISASFLSHPNVDPSLLHQDWIKNHYRWIVWKLASLEKSLPKIASGRFLIPVNVLHQLKYRYDREIDLAQRPALRKILECDAPASRRFIACVADIRKIESEELESKVEIELTDGWYSVWTTIDIAMEDLINKKKIKIGTKLIIHGAELLNCSDGCDPLELNNSIRLKLHTNSVRRVKWFAKMGFTQCPGPLGISLDSILPNGGLVGLTTAVVARVYPLLYMSKDSNEKTVIRNSYTENKIAAVNEKQRHLKTEELYEKILAEVEGKYKKVSSVKYDLKKIKQITNPEVLWRIVSNESDSSEVHSLLSTDQLQALQKYHDQISTKIQEEVNKILQEKLEELVPARKVTILLKIRLADPLTECSAIVTVWRPSEDVCCLLSENRYLDFYALNSCGTRDKVLQLANTKHSRYKESTLFSQTNKFSRKVTDISDLVFHSSFPVFGELDVVGIVVFVKEPDKPWGVSNVYLSDTKNNFLMITFWTSLKVFGFEEILREGSVIAAVNLHWRQGYGSYVVPSTFANEVTYFSTNPSQKYLSQEIQAAKRFLSDKGGADYVESRKEVLLSLIKDRGCQLPKPLTPLRQKENTISNKIERLKSYGPASPLPKVPLLSSPDIHKHFRSPKTCKTTPKSS